ncbi:hypothetical protein SLEP1_g21795 [Rubroshorea leprosula]|uniref:Uncharacterized protein n=1 Tax=Rubroshorea leprosula TaxID=152421 RepID=A0AAV5J767_9ROSI|nr:hypothetical protein SLEP1_g21795 [Rubroshorea leprosula]
MPMAKQLRAFSAFILIIFLFGSTTTTEARKAAFDPVGSNDLIPDVSEPSMLQADEITDGKRPRAPDELQADITVPKRPRAPDELKLDDQIIGVKRPRPPDVLELDQIIGVKRPRPPDVLELDQIIGVKRPRPPDVLESDQIIGVKRPRPPDVLEPDQVIGVKRPRPPKLQADPPPVSLFATISDPAEDTTQAAKNLVVHSGFSTEYKVPTTPSSEVRQFGFP